MTGTKQREEEGDTCCYYAPNTTAKGEPSIVEFSGVNWSESLDYLQLPTPLG